VTDFGDVIIRPKPKQMSALAINQLEAWRKFARRWMLVPEERARGEISEIHLVCHGLQYQDDTLPKTDGCGISVFQIHDGQNWRYLDLETIEALVTAHIRNVHREIEHIVYSGG
jgi:hypothetical protein